MAEKDASLTRETYNALLKAVNDNGWACIHDDDRLNLQYGVKVDDLQLDFYVMLDAERQLAVLVCKMPFTFVEGNRVDGAVETSAINYELVDGNFCYDFPNGLCHFKMTISYRESVISSKAFEFMLNYSVWAIQKYYKRLYRIALGIESAE